MSRARVLAIGDTHVGMKRTHNEDSFMLAEEDNLYVVADGMGGHASGDVASGMAIDTLRDFFRATSADPEATWPYKMDKARGYEENRLITGIKLANLRIYEAAQKDPHMHSMGTTVVGILVVEDDAAFLDLVSQILRIAGYEVLTAEHALAAVFAMVRAGADLVLTDIRMPIVDGLDLVRELKSHADTQHVPVVVITGFDTAESRAAAQEAGCVGYVVKPINFDKFLGQIAEILGVKQ